MPQVRHLSPLYIERIPTSGSGSLFRVQIRRYYCQCSFRRDLQWRQGDRRMGWLASVFLCFSCECFLPCKCHGFKVQATKLTTMKLRSLKYVLLPENSIDSTRGAMHTVARSQRNRRTQFLFIYSYVVQFIFMWALSRP
jgi:hypothetical protein